LRQTRNAVAEKFIYFAVYVHFSGNIREGKEKRRETEEVEGMSRRGEKG
jgi:hypothetical protein